MHKYDCIVIGNTETALLSAAYLSRAKKHVALIVNDKKTALETAVKQFKDETGKVFRYSGLSQPIGGLASKGLLAFYLQKTGVNEALNVVATTPSRIVTKEGRVLSQDRGLDAFQVYLIRHFPKYREAIEAFFKDIYTHYHSYKHERQNRLMKRPYVIDSLRAQWGNLNLDTVLKRYFESDEIRKAFTLQSQWQGIPHEMIAAHAYFRYFFNQFMEPLYYIDAPISTLQSNILKRNDTLTVVKKRLSRCVVEQDRIQSIELEDGTKLEAEAYYIHEHPEVFMHHFVDKDRGLHIENISGYFLRQPLETTMYTYYVGLDQSTDTFGIDAVETIYEEGAFKTDDASLHMTLDYSAVYSKAASTPNSALIVQATSKSPLSRESLTNLLKTIDKNIDKHITLVRTLSAERTRTTFNPFLAAQKSLKAKTDLEASEHARVFTNGFFLDYAMILETKFAGGIILSIDLADAVLTYLEDETSVVKMIEPAALINAFAYPLKAEPKHNGKRLSITIANQSFVLTFTHGRPTIFNGFDQHADASIEIDEKAMHDWLFTDQKYTSIQTQGACHMAGDKALLKSIIDGQLAMSESINIKTTETTKVSGSVFMIISIAAFVLWSTLALYFPKAFIFTIAAVIQGGYLIWYRKQFVRATTWDSFALIAYTVYAALLWIFGDITWLAVHWLVFGAGIFWLLNSAIKNPLPYAYYIQDYPKGYAGSSYFVSLMSGLGIIIGGSIIVFFLTMHRLQGGNQLIGILAIVIALYLALNYPERYERAMIKRRK